MFPMSGGGRTVCLMTTPESEQADLERPKPAPADGARRERDAALLRAVRGLHEARPLSTFLWGTQEVWFAGGGRARRHTCQRDAATFERVWTGKEASEPVHWHTGRWASFDTERVAMVEWTRDRTYGADYSPEDKVVLHDKGYDRGHLGALVDLWKNPREPSYSPLVVEWLLRSAALEPSSSHHIFTTLARAYEGAEGAERARMVWETADREKRAVLSETDEGDTSSHVRLGEADDIEAGPAADLSDGETEEGGPSDV